MRDAAGELADGVHLLRMAQPLLGGAALAHVLTHRENAGEAVLGIVERHVVPLAENLAAVPRHVLGRRVDLAAAGGQLPEESLDQRLRGRRRDEAERLPAAHLLEPVAKDALGRLVPVDETELGIVEDAADRHAIEDHLEPLGERGPLGLGEQVGGDVLVHHGHVADAAVAPAQRERRDLDRHPPSLGDMHVGDVARVIPERRDRHGLAGECTLDEREHANLGRLLVAQCVVAGRRLAAEDLAEFRICQDAVAVGRIDLESDGRMGEQPGEQCGGIIDV